jgi:pimeloyl-ACP methyl ester carboxylesterase
MAFSALCQPRQVERREEQVMANVASRAAAAAAGSTPEHIEHRIRTGDGRVLAVAEWGDPNGLGLFALHGTPGGRISYWIDLSIYARHGLRRFTVDRPGYGASTRLAGRHVADIVPDIVAIADQLGVREFAVSGGSGGGPHALACAALLGDRVLRCMADVSPAPYPAEGLDWLAGMTAGNVEEFEATLAGEEVIRSLAERERTMMLERLADGRSDFLGDNFEMSESDQAQLIKHFARIADELRNALLPGVDGWVDDDIAFTKTWGFDVGSINVPVYLTYGRSDTLVPPGHGDWLAAHIPGAIVEIVDAGHLGDDKTVESEMAWLAGRA